MFANSMACSCYGNGEKVALLIPGEPGNSAPNTEWQGKFGIKALLPCITVPVLMIGVDQDVYLPEALARETTDLVANCTLCFYEGKRHLDAGLDKRIAGHILEFIGRA